MSNRHERRRTAKIGSVQKMSAADLAKIPTGCAWSGCMCNTEDPDKAGWSKLILYRGRTKLDFMDIAPDLMDRDAVLCPDHAKALHEDVLVHLGGFDGLFNARPQGSA
jgi:hypothetical protein